MRKLPLILVLAMGLVSMNTTARAETKLLDNLVVQEPEESIEVDLLEELVKNQKITAPPIQQRLYSFFKRHKVQRPEFYASLLARHPMPEKKKKMMAAIIVPESRGNANAVSPVGATGVWQVMPFWKRLLKIKGSLKDPVVNLDAASRVYDIHAKDAHGNQDRALYAYSGGSAWYPRKIRVLMAQI